VRWFLFRWILATAALWGTASILPTCVKLEGLLPAFLATAVIGLLNALVSPILFIFKVVTFPINLLTLGLFSLLTSFVMNTLIFWGVGRSGWIQGFSVPGLVAAAKAAVVMSIINGLLTWVARGARQ
jgi:putative membrane protein